MYGVYVDSFSNLCSRRLVTKLQERQNNHGKVLAALRLAFLESCLASTDESIILRLWLRLEPKLTSLQRLVRGTGVYMVVVWVVNGRLGWFALVLRSVSASKSVLGAHEEVAVDEPVWRPKLEE